MRDSSIRFFHKKLNIYAQIVLKCEKMSEENENKQIERIRLDLEGVDAKKLRFVKKHRGFKKNTEAVRVLIHEEFKRLGGKEEML